MSVRVQRRVFPARRIRDHPFFFGGHNSCYEHCHRTGLCSPLLLAALHGHHQHDLLLNITNQWKPREKRSQAGYRSRHKHKAGKQKWRRWRGFFGFHERQAEKTPRIKMLPCLEAVPATGYCCLASTYSTTYSTVQWLGTGR